MGSGGGHPALCVQAVRSLRILPEPGLSGALPAPLGHGQTPNLTAEQQGRRLPRLSLWDSFLTFRQ